MTGERYWLTPKAVDLLAEYRTSPERRYLLAEELADLSLELTAIFGPDAALDALAKAQTRVIEKTGGIV